MKRWRVRRERYPEFTKSGKPWQAWDRECDTSSCKCSEFDTHQEAINHATDKDNQ